MAQLSILSSMKLIKKYIMFSGIKHRSLEFNNRGFKRILPLCNTFRVSFLIIYFFCGCLKYTPSREELDQPFGFAIFNYIINFIAITTEGWNVVTLNEEDSSDLYSLIYYRGKLYVGGDVNYLVDLAKGEKIPWINGLTVNGTAPSKDGIYALTRNYLLVEENTQKRFCPIPSDLVIQNFGYTQRGEKILEGESNDLYIGFKNSVNVQQFFGEQTASYDCSIYKFNIGGASSQSSCTSNITVPMTLFAGTPGSCFLKDGGLTTSYFRDIVELMYDKDRNMIYVCENKAIRQIDISQRIVSTLVGTQSQNVTIADGALSIARVVSIGGCFYKNNNIFFTDRNSVRRLDILTRRISTLADGKTRSNFQLLPRDGKGGSAMILQPSSITGDDEGNLYFLDKVNFFENSCGQRARNYLRKISPPELPVSKNLITTKGISFPDKNVCFSPDSTYLLQDGVEIFNQSNFVMDAQVGTTLTKTFTIQNRGQFYETFRELVIQGNATNPPIYNISSITPFSIPPGGTGSFTISFTPPSQGNHNNWLNINYYNSQYSKFFFSIQGNGTP